MTPTLRTIGPALLLWGLLLLIVHVIGPLLARLGIVDLTLDLVLSVTTALVILDFCRVDRSRIGRLLRGSGFSRGGWLKSVGALVLLVVVVGTYFRLLQWIGFEMEQVSDIYGGESSFFWILPITFCLMPGVFEELAFRGVVLGRLNDALSTREAIVVQAAMFSLLHLAPSIFLSHFFMGLVLGWLRLRTCSLYPPMAVHMIWNGLVVAQEMMTTPDS